MNKSQLIRRVSDFSVPFNHIKHINMFSLVSDDNVIVNNFKYKVEILNYQ